MSVKISLVENGSLSQRAGIQAGDVIEKINGQAIKDVLDYRFYLAEKSISIELTRDSSPFMVFIDKDEYEDIGLDFDSYLMDDQRTCKNKCIFCFIDQLPKGMRKTLYFKDDDSRMSFLFGNYVTLTNMSDEDIDRIIKMRLEPINISVHTTDPELRLKMLKNPRSGTTLGYLRKLADANIAINAQLVLCPYINDGEELRRTLNDLESYLPALRSIALVPLGLTKHRDGLPQLEPMTKERAIENLDIADEFAGRMIEKYGARLVFPADEMFILAERPIPDAEYYEDFDQLEDGVGTYAMQKRDLLDELAVLPANPDLHRTVSIACGTSAAPLLRALLDKLKPKFPNVNVLVYAIENKLFGSSINVTGLLCGTDIGDALLGRELGEELLLARVMFKKDTDIFLDDTTAEQLAERLDTQIRIVDVDGVELLYAVLGEEMAVSVEEDFAEWE